ncbi:MAG: hypothetical protein ABI293_01325 [Rhodanobacter sp.]
MPPTNRSATDAKLRGEAELVARYLQLPRNDPGAALDKIQRLTMHGHDGEAHQRLCHFRQAHPNWPLPPVLPARMPKP